MGNILACDLDSRRCKQSLEGVRKDASCDEEQAMEIARDYHASWMTFSVEELAKLIAEAGERAVELSYLNMGEVRLLLKHSELITIIRDNIYVEVPSGTLCYAQMEDGVIEILEAQRVERREEPDPDPVVSNDDAYGCDHCGTEETEVLDTEGLCPTCAKEQEEFDDGECPRCGCPSPGGRECYNC